MARLFPGWELPNGQGSDNVKDAFEDLLNELRTVHAKVCVRNSYLESALNSVHATSADASWQQDVFVMPVPKESTLDVLLSRPPCRSGAANDRRFIPRTPPRTPRSEVSTILHKIAKEQTQLHDKITQMMDPSRRSNEKQVKWSSSLNGKCAVHCFETKTQSSDEPNRSPSEWHVSCGATKSLDSPTFAAAASEYYDGTLSSYLRNIVNSNLFVGVTSTMLLSYAVFIAIDTELLAINGGEQSSGVTVMHVIYNIAFTCELLVRIGAEGRRFFFGESPFLNWFDSVLVFSILLDLILALWSANLGRVKTAGNLMRTVRIIRVVRTMRLVRALHQLYEFQKMAFALATSFKTLLHSMMIVFFVTFFFAVVFTQSAADKDLRESIDDLEMRYGGLATTIFTLFLSMSNGISWQYAYEPIAALGPPLAMCFVVYIIISMFGVLNVVTSVFVESVIRSAQHHKELLVQDKEQEKLIALGHMREIFRQVDSDGSGQVNSDELEYFLNQPDLRKYIDALDINPEDTRLLFRLLDRDGSQVIDIAEFCEGCLRLKGNARSIDVQTLIFQMKNFFSTWEAFTDFVELRLDATTASCRRSSRWRRSHE